MPLVSCASVNVKSWASAKARRCSSVREKCMRSLFNVADRVAISGLGAVPRNRQWAYASARCIAFWSCSLLGVRNVYSLPMTPIINCLRYCTIRCRDPSSVAWRVFTSVKKGTNVHRLRLLVMFSFILRDCSWF